MRSLPVHKQKYLLTLTTDTDAVWEFDFHLRETYNEIVAKKKKSIGIMGGTFDPVHVGHLVVAEEARIVKARH